MIGILATISGYAAEHGDLTIQRWEFDIQKTASRWETINDLYPNVVYVMSNDVKLF